MKYKYGERFQIDPNWIPKQDRRVAKVAKEANTGLSIIWITILIAGAIFVLKFAA